jgi:hypothetical protein
MTDAIGRLISAFRVQAGFASVARKLDVLIVLESSHDERILPFLLEVLADDRQPTSVRIHVLRRVRNGGLTPANRFLIAEVMRQLVVDGSSPELRLRATIALGEFADAPGVIPALGQMALNEAAPIDLRYGAFTSLERAGPLPACIDVLRQLESDESLGPAARSALHVWHVPEEKA